MHNILSTSRDISLLRLMQLCSATLPVGAYAFSFGLEHAIESKCVQNEHDVKTWLSLSISHAMVSTDIPILQRLLIAVSENDNSSIVYWNQFLLACRETYELRLSDIAMGQALKRLLVKLQLNADLLSVQNITFMTCFAGAVVHWRINKSDAVLGYMWSWLENQVAAATKLLPMGQSAAQLMLFELAQQIPQAIKQSETMSNEDLGASMPGLNMASAWHETQYSRLYRS